MFKKILLIAFFVTLPALANQGFQQGISIFGDLKYPANFYHFDYVNPYAPKKGEVRLGSEGGFNSLNQFILKGIPAAGLSYLYDSLTVNSDDEISARYGLIAEGMKVSSDRLSIEFKLRKNAVFHDGKNVTADDVVFTFNTLINDGHPSYKMALRDVKNVEKINNHLVRFNFKNNHNKNLILLVASLPVLPKHYYQNHDFTKSGLEIPLGSGPYKIKEVKVNREIVYERVKDYWAKDLSVNRGRYNFDKIAFDYYRDANVLIEAFKAQKYDFRQENIARNWVNAYNIEAVKNGEIIKKLIPHALPAPAQVFAFNLRKEKFQNLALRKALTYAFDFEWLNKHIFYNAYIRTNSYFANSEFAYNFELPKSDGDGFNRKNLLKAREILLNAGYKIVNNKLIDPKNNQVIEIEFLIDSKPFEMVVAPFIQHLRQLGIDAKMRFVEENQYQTRVNNFDYDAIIAVLPQNLAPGDELFSYWHSSQVDIKGGRNLSGLKDKVVDDLVERISKTSDKKELKDLCKKLDKRLLENYYTILQWHNNSHRVLYRDIFVRPKVQAKYSLSFDSWYLK
jgi:microcin C transport system substrate-binding protein